MTMHERVRAIIANGGSCKGVGASFGCDCPAQEYENRNEDIFGQNGPHNEAYFARKKAWFENWLATHPEGDTHA